MDLKSSISEIETLFSFYITAISAALGHVDRTAPFQSYCQGLLLPGDRKSVEPLAARVQPARFQAADHSLHHFAANADWSNEAVLSTLRPRVLPMIERHGRVRALIIDRDCPEFRARGRFA